MTTRNLHRRRRQGGFTLIEVLVTIGIIAVLVSVLIPAVRKIRDSAYKAATQNQINILTTAIQAYSTDFNGAYPGPLPLNQLDVADASVNDTTGTAFPFVYSADGVTAVPLDPTSVGGAAARGHITGAENLVLGLLGGLKVNRANTPYTFAFDSTLIYPSMGDPTPDPKGPQPLGTANNAKAQTAYVNVKSGDLSAGAFKLNDIAANDSAIPEFTDKFAEPMPFLYLRARRGAAGVVTFAGNSKPDGSGNALSTTDASSNKIPLPCQYDLREVYGYTSSAIGLNLSDARINQNQGGMGFQAVGGGHGLQFVWLKAVPTTTSLPSLGRPTDTSMGPKSVQIDGWAYLRAPDIGPQPTGDAVTTDTGTPRSKDSFILISPGSDRIYGTADDIVSFGPVGP